MSRRPSYKPLCVSVCFAVASAFVLAGQRVAATPQPPAGTAARASEAMSTDKVRQITPGIKRQVAAQTAASGKTWSPDARALAVTDLEAQTKALASSGSSVETIKQRNEAYLAALNTLLPGGTAITAGTYQEARRTLFTHFVNLTIETIPAGATVMMEGRDIGITSIASRLVEPGRRYRFEFTLPGYHSSAREFYVSPAPDTQTISEALTPDPHDAAAGDAQGGGGGSSAAVPPRRGDRLWVYAAIASVGVVIGLVLLTRLNS